MSDTRYLDWPFFEERHRQLARELDAWAVEHIPHEHSADVDTECRALVQALGAGG
jgi:acyl-CoA dehydrogenase